MNNLSEELKYWRCERPSEYKMDDFIRQVEQLEKERDELKEAFTLAYDHLCDLHIIVSDLPKTTFIKGALQEVKETAKTNRLFIEKKKEED